MVFPTQSIGEKHEKTVIVCVYVCDSINILRHWSTLGNPYMCRRRRCKLYAWPRFICKRILKLSCVYPYRGWIGGGWVGYLHFPKLRAVCEMRAILGSLPVRLECRIFVHTHTYIYIPCACGAKRKMQFADSMKWLAAKE